MLIVTVESRNDMSECAPIIVRSAGASIATLMLLMREYVANKVIEPPSIPVITGAAVAVGQNTQINAPWAMSELKGAIAIYAATAPKICMNSNIHMKRPM